MESLSYSFEGRGLLFTDDAIETVGFAQSILPDLSRKSSLSNQFLETSCDDTSDQSGGKSVISTSTITLNSLMEFGTRLSCSMNRKASDANLASDENLAASSESTQHRTRFSTDNSALSAKRARISNLQSQIPTCQVHGCSKDLSSSKDYHKRHKVCDVHSKTAVVIVNGIRQRFCQQCSRFHILAEFDEGKRSCRKRLAGHNERRRKPQFDTHLSSSYFTTDASKSSLLFSGILPSSFLGLQCNEPTNHITRLKLENEQSQLSELALHMKFSQSLPQSILHLHGNIGKQYPILSVPESSAASNCSRALSLLSVQSQNSNYQTTLGRVRNSVPNHSVGFEASQESNCLDLKRYLSPEGANTVDLIELSLHLQRVEQQKYYAQVKLENGVFCQSTTT